MFFKSYNEAPKKLENASYCAKIASQKRTIVGIVVINENTLKIA